MDKAVFNNICGYLNSYLSCITGASYYTQVWHNVMPEGRYGAVMLDCGAQLDVGDWETYEYPDLYITLEIGMDYDFVSDEIAVLPAEKFTVDCSSDELEVIACGFQKWFVDGLKQEEGPDWRKVWTEFDIEYIDLVPTLGIVDCAVSFLLDVEAVRQRRAGEALVG